ncbi:uncharacterized protein LOC110063687 [Orbicella faveolata]|uniref:uncharacterized protein LOC110063687 n=1 Tax=Orbicella faveolata TaxID=48498 RepID=UPI0009E23573|nr:uncharacterized protein LOC110063687 [Orbicella faveolata]XP_020626347.1 uncharacterized protein LOC110063687 [Orbicella faveolata]XP_020626348.1 uncharacterized protein LOC110063687 [Orbicella faveolata]
MEKQIFLRIVFGIVLKDVFTTGVNAYSCPSSPVTYASEGDNVTMCWKLLPENEILRFSVMALKRPVEAVMEKVATVNRDGTFFKFYEVFHDGLYVNRVTADADLQTSELFLRLTNFTSKMQNIYCIKYEILGKDDVSTCHSEALILRDIGLQPPKTTVETTTVAVTNRTEAKAPPTKGRRVASSNQNTIIIIIILGCLLGVVSVLAIIGFMLFCHARKREPLPAKPKEPLVKKV